MQCMHYRTWLKLLIPTEAEPLDFARDRLREAQRRDLFCCLRDKRRSLDYAARLGGFARDDGINSHVR
jgi:hypothetical protein